MTRRNPERPPGPSYYRLPEASWTMIRDEYLSGWTAKEIGKKWRVSPTSVYRHASDGGWNKNDRGQAFHDQITASADEGPPGETWTSLKDPVPPSMRRWPQPLPGMRPMRRPVWEPPPGYGPMPPHLVPPVPRPPEQSGDETDPPSPAEAAEQAVAAAARALTAGRYQEAERLGRLAAILKKVCAPAPGGSPPKRAEAPFSVEDEAEPPENERPLHCTPDTCLVLKAHEEAYAKTAWLFGERLKREDVSDILAWTDMMDGLGAPIQDEDLRRLAADLKAKGPGELHRQIEAATGRPPAAFYRPAAPAPALEP